MTIKTVTGTRRGTRRATLRRATVPALLTAGALTLGAAYGSGSVSAAQVPQEKSPYTGVEAQQSGVLAVKFDNARGARPHQGLNKADIVYVEKVEGGMSRLMGVYSGRQPESVGPVRSARESDVELLRQFGRPALAYSGVRSELNKVLRDSPLYARSHGSVPSAYLRKSGRQAPHNLFVRPQAILESAPNASRPADIGFRFGAAPAGGTKAGERTVRYSAASHTFRWSPSDKRWKVSFDGAAAMQTNGRQMAPRTVVIQHVDMPPSKYKDVNGASTPYIETVGSGRATVLRDGKAYATQWKRPSATSGTTFTLADGRRMPFAPGQVWVVYADR
ncbi:putative lipoprotein YerB precursor [Streptomyces sp. YIM 130001]|uniref:DUF3048 domain-containing protein n=1 Tax=Streptomyces sp. YIM 130001 TaxID=2259644 RepID=UPI000E651830|nr:DUF3048 domain-containing protein [Streptomyces sp. YIM 130001]RII12310.1 putative lipoprotein YerB precursor [Streptomyces sp. YIM 130001]